MSEFNITVPGGESKRLKTKGMYCPADIVVTAEGSVVQPEGEYLTPEFVYSTTRPSDWLPLPIPGNNEMYLLCQTVMGKDGFFAAKLTFSGSCVVEFGTVSNGEFVSKTTMTPSSGSRFTRNVPISECEAETTGDRKQFVVKISGNVTQASFAKTATQQKNNYIVDICCGMFLSKLELGMATYGSRDLPSLRYFRFVGNGGLSNGYGAFAACHNLLCASCERKLTLSDYRYMFHDAKNLKAISGNFFGNTSTAEATGMFQNGRFAGFSGQVKISNGSSFLRDAVCLRFDGAIIDTSSCTNIGTMFYGCKSVTEINSLDISSVTNVGGAFGSCNSLEKLTFAGKTTPGGWTFALDNTSLDHASLVEMIASLPTATAAAVINITGNPGAAELTDAEIAVATAKNWSVTL